MVSPNKINKTAEIIAKQRAKLLTVLSSTMADEVQSVMIHNFSVELGFPEDSQQFKQLVHRW